LVLTLGVSNGLVLTRGVSNGLVLTRGGGVSNGLALTRASFARAVCELRRPSTPVEASGRDDETVGVGGFGEDVEDGVCASVLMWPSTNGLVWAGPVTGMVFLARSRCDKADRPRRSTRRQ
jgi:hypothetical protein